ESLSDIGSWGHEYLRNLAGKVAQEYTKRQIPQGVADEEIKKRMESWSAQSQNGVVILLSNDKGYAEHISQVVEESHKTVLIYIRTRIHKSVEFYPYPRFDLDYVIKRQWDPKVTTAAET
ncbi:unnamed protein product, partial [Arabidopsis halleri]